MKKKGKSDNMVEKAAEWHENGNLRGLIKASKYQGEGETVIRSVGIMGLGKIGNKRAIKALIKALKDDDGTVRFASAHELVKLQVPKIMEILQDTFSEDEYKRCLVYIMTVEKK